MTPSEPRPSGGVRIPILLLLVATAAAAQQYTISTFAGGAPPSAIPAAAAGISNPLSVAVDRSGNIYFVSQQTVLRVDGSSGQISLAAGKGTTGFSGDQGQAVNAELNRPTAVAVDAAGVLYFADTGNNRIRKVSGGIITTIAGGGTALGDTGAATSAMLASPQGVAVDAAGAVYIADTNNHRVRKVAGGVITTVAGTGNPAFSGDTGPATSAGLNAPTALAFDASGNLYIATQAAVRLVVNNVITTVAGTGVKGFNGDDIAATTAQINQPQGIAIDPNGILYIADTGNHRIRRVSSNIISTLAGKGTPGFAGDGSTPFAAQFDTPVGVAVDSALNILIADSGNLRIRKIVGGALVSTVVGGATQLGDNGPAAAAQVSFPRGLAIGPGNTLYIADPAYHRVRRVSGATIGTVAGIGTSGFSGDLGQAVSAQLSAPQAVAADAAGNLYIADSGNHRVRKVTGSVITTIAGTGVAGFTGDLGAATSAQLSAPNGLAVDSAGNLYVSDSGNRRIRKVANGIITTVAGNGSTGSATSGPATGVALGSIGGLAVDSAGNLFLADSSNSAVRKISAGAVTTVAGGGLQLGDGGAATSAQLSSPFGIFVDAADNLYLADTYNHRVRKVTGGQINTIAGTGQAGLTGDGGAATSAQLNSPMSVAVDALGNVYVADFANSRVRLLANAANAACQTVVVPASSEPVPAGDYAAGAAITVTATGEVSLANDDKYATEANGYITKEPSLGTPAYSYFASLQPTGAPQLGGRKFFAGIPVGALLGYYAPKGATSLPAGATPFLVGSSYTAQAPNNAGSGGARLYLAVNDASRGDNSGQFSATVADGTCAAPSYATLSASDIAPFVYQTAGATPGVQVITLTSSLNGSVTTIPYVVERPAESWLTISPVTGSAPATLNISVDPTGLAQGVYESRFAVRSPSVPVPFSLRVTLTVTASVVVPSQAGLAVWANVGANPDIRSVFRGGTSAPAPDLTRTTSYVCRGPYTGGIHPGKYTPAVNRCTIADGTAAVDLINFDLLTNFSGVWVAGSNGSIPNGTFVTGQEAGLNYYSCRAWVGGGIEIGKLRADSKGCAIAFNGTAASYPIYEVATNPWAVSQNGGEVPNMLVAGRVGTDGTAVLYVCRGNYQGGVYLGKFLPGQGCSIVFGNQGVQLATFEVLTTTFTGQWVAVAAARAPAGALIGGISAGAIQYVCRLQLGGGLHPGKLISGQGCQVQFGTSTQVNTSYEVLVPTPAMATGPFKIRARASNRYWVETDDRLIGTQTQPDNASVRFTLQSQASTGYRIFAQADNRQLVLETGTRQLSARSTPNDDTSVFLFEQSPDGAYRIRSKADNGYLAEGPDDRLISARTQLDDEYARFFLEPVASATVSATPAIQSFTVDKVRITAGESAILTWSTTDVDAVTIDNRVGSVFAAGSVQVTPAGTTTYTLTASNRNGSTTRQVTIAVTAPTISVVNGASFAPAPVAADSIATLFGSGMAAQTVINSSNPPPNTLGGVTVSVQDASGVSRPAPLFFVSAGQINFAVPAGTATGTARITVTSSANAQTTFATIAPVAPGIFTVGATTVPAALYSRYAGDQPMELNLLMFNPNTGAAVPLVRNAGEQIYLSLYGTGIRAHTPTGVTATLGGVSVPVLGAVAQGQFLGEDQINIGPIPLSLPAGSLTLALTVDGLAANKITVLLQ